jgi:hypothetical protein
MFSDTAFMKLNEVFTTMFNAKDDRTGKITDSCGPQDGQQKA